MAGRGVVEASLTGAADGGSASSLGLDVDSSSAVLPYCSFMIRLADV